MSDETISDIASANLQRAVTDGPRLSSGYGIVVLARYDGKVLLGGLGGLGVGVMEFDEAAHHADLPGYADAADNREEGARRWFNEIIGPADDDVDSVRRVAETDWRAQEEARRDRYRAEVRETFQRFSDRALAYQDSIIRGGIDREECDREIERRRRLRGSGT